jgi:hypothetical protein
MTNDLQSIPASFRSSPTLNEALREARRFIRLRYFTFLVTVGILFGAGVVAAAVLVVSLLSDTGWEQQVASGAVAGAAVLLLVMLQYRPAGSFAAAGAEIFQLEALRADLEKSYDLWDVFLQQREARQQVSANDVATAVSSMASATRDLVAAQTELMRSSSRPSRNREPGPSSLPTPTFPDPRRY